jgi:transposase
MKTRDARSLPAVAQQELRHKAVTAVREGDTQVEVARRLGVSRYAVWKWVRAYRQGGKKALTAKRRGRPKGGSLQPWQAAQIAKSVVDRRPEQLKLPFYLWTREAVAQLIERRFAIRLSVWTVGRYLARWGFTPQKPLRRAFEQNPEAVRRWLEQEYPAIRTQAQRQKARIFWGDEMGVRSDHAGGRSYARRGKTPVIPAPGQRFGCNLMSAISNRGKLYFMVFTNRFRAPVFLDFLKRLVRQVEQKVFLIVDRHPVHRSATVHRWREQHADRIQLFFLPGYSPELNPDEMLNQDVKANAVARRRARDQQQLMTHLRGYLRSRQRQPHVVKRYFEAPSVRYAAIQTRTQTISCSP